MEGKEGRFDSALYWDQRKGRLLTERDPEESRGGKNVVAGRGSKGGGTGGKNNYCIKIFHDLKDTGKKHFNDGQRRNKVRRKGWVIHQNNGRKKVRKKFWQWGMGKWE